MAKVIKMSEFAGKQREIAAGVRQSDQLLSAFATLPREQQLAAMRALEQQLIAELKALQGRGTANA